MPAVRYNIVVEQGANFEVTFRARNVDQSAMDLSGFSGRMQIRSAASSNDVLLEASSANGRIAIEGLTGTIAVTIPADVTGALDWQAGVYDLEVFNGATNVIRIAEGFAYLSPEVTR